jgi:2',3'-cyclic-nucleotide 2'-phosphodiesterase (5'-nucleotidase family)
MLTAETIVKAYREIGYDGVAVSGSDLSAGQAFFQKSKQSDFPWISANVKTGNGKLFFSPFIKKRIGNLNIGIIGLTGQAGNFSKEFMVGDWKEALIPQIEVLKEETDMIILLSNLPFSQNTTIARTVPEIDIIISADKKRGNFTPKIFGNALITQTKGRGKFIGKLTLKYSPEDQWENDFGQMLTSVKKRISAVEHQIEQLKAQKKLFSEQVYSRKLNRLRSRKKNLQEDLVTIEQKRKNNSTANQFRGLLLPIRPEAGHSERIDQMINKLKEQINSYFGKVKIE